MSYQYPFIPTALQTSYRQWDDHQQDQHQHQEEQQHPIVPSQSRPGSSHVVEGDRLQHASVPALLQPDHLRPPMIDTTRVYHQTSASPSSGPPSAGPSAPFRDATGPIRARVSPVQNPRTAAHPYHRPQSAAGVFIAKSRREPEAVHSVRQQKLSSTSCTPVDIPTSFGVNAAAKTTSMIKGLTNLAYSATGNHFIIRTDIHFNSETSVLTALCELPGRTKTDVSVVLSTNAMNRVKQVVVTAKPPQEIIADGGCVLRERKTGSVSRTFVVPSETTPDDITAEMHDGVLSLKIQCPPPSFEDDAQEIVVR